LKQQNVKLDDGNDFSLSSVIHRQRKSKDESISPTSISPVSPQSNSNQLLFSSPSFVNPRNTLLRQQTDTNHFLPQMSTLSLTEENSNQSQTKIGNLLDLEENNLNDESIFEGSFSSDIQQRKLSSSFDSQTNLLDDSDILISQINSTPIIFPSLFVPTTIPEAEEKSSSEIFHDRCQAFLM
jgi:hypothetical protein